MASSSDSSSWDEPSSSYTYTDSGEDEYLCEEIGEEMFDDLVDPEMIGRLYKKKRKKLKKKASDAVSGLKKKKKKLTKGASDAVSSVKKKKKKLKKRVTSAQDSAKQKVSGFKRKAKEKASEAGSAVKRKFKRRKKGDQDGDDQGDADSSTSKRKKKKDTDKEEGEETEDQKAKRRKKKEGEENGEEDEDETKRKKKEGEDEDEDDEEAKRRKKEGEDDDEKDSEKKARPDIDTPDLPDAGTGTDAGGPGLAGAGVGGGDLGAGGGAVALTAEEEALTEVEPTDPAEEQRRLAREARARDEEERAFREQLYRERIRLEQEQARQLAQKQAAERALAEADSQAEIAQAQAQITEANSQLETLEEEENVIEESAREEGFDPNDIDGDGVSDEREALVTIPSVDSGPFYSEDPNDLIFQQVAYDSDQDPGEMVSKFEQEELTKELSESDLEDDFEGGDDLNDEEEDKADWQLKPNSQVPDPNKGKRSFLERVSEEPDGLLNAIRGGEESVRKVPGSGQPAKINVANDPQLLEALANTYPDSRFFRYSDNAVRVDTGQEPKDKPTFSFSGLLRKTFTRDQSDAGDGSLSVAGDNFGNWNDPAPTVARTTNRIGAGADQLVASSSSSTKTPTGLPVARLWPSSVRAPRWIPAMGIDAYQALVLFFVAFERFHRDQDNTSKEAILSVIPMQFWRTLEAVPGISQAQANAAYDFLRLLAILMVRSVINRENPKYKALYKNASIRILRDFSSIIGLQGIPQFNNLKEGKDLLLQESLPLLRPTGVPLIRDKTPTSWTLERVMEDLGKRLDHVIMIKEPQVAKGELDRAVSMLDGVRTTTFYERLGPVKGEQFLDLLVGWARNFGEAVLDIQAPDKRTMAMRAAKQLYQWLEKEDQQLAGLWQAYIRYLTSHVQSRQGASQYDNLRLIGRTLDPWSERKPSLPAPAPPLQMDPAKLPSPQEYQRALDTLSVAHDRVPKDRSSEDVARSLEKKETTLTPPAKPTPLHVVKGDRNVQKAVDQQRGQMDARCFLVYWCVKHTRFGQRVAMTHRTTMDAWIWLRFEAPSRIWDGLCFSLVSGQANSSSLPKPSSKAVLAVKVAPLLCEGFSTSSLRTDRVSMEAECCKQPEKFMERVREAVKDESALRQEFVNNLCSARYHLVHTTWVLHSPANASDHKKQFAHRNQQLLQLIEGCKGNRGEQVFLKRLYHLVLVRHKHASASHSILALLHKKAPCRYTFFDNSFEACF